MNLCRSLNLFTAEFSHLLNGGHDGCFIGFLFGLGRLNSQVGLSKHPFSFQCLTDALCFGYPGKMLAPYPGNTSPNH